MQWLGWIVSSSVTLFLFLLFLQWALRRLDVLLVVGEGEATLVQWFDGSSSRVLHTGWHWRCPVLEQPRQVQWRFTVVTDQRGGQRQEQLVTRALPTGQSVHHLPPVRCTTRDGASTTVRLSLYYQLVDVRKAALASEPLLQLECIAAACLGAAVENMKAAGVTRPALEKAFKSRFGEENFAESWGLQLTRCVVTELWRPSVRGDVREHLADDLGATSRSLSSGDSESSDTEDEATKRPPRATRKARRGPLVKT